MIRYAKWRGLVTVEVVAFATGLLIWWNGTDFSVFEALIGTISIATFVWWLKHRSVVSIFNLLDTRALVLVGFAILVASQFLFASDNVPLFAATTLYLIGLYFLIRFWLRQKPSLFDYFLFAYLVTALAMSTFGLGHYLLAIVPIEWNLAAYEIRWQGFLDDPVVYASLLVPAIMVFGRMAVYAESARQYVTYIAAALLCFSSLILTGSRGAWLGLIVSALVLALLDRVFFQSQKFFRALIGSSAALIMALLLVYIVPLDGRTYYASTLEHRGPASDEPRIENFRLAPELIFERPPLTILMGSGNGSYERFSPNGFSAHNTYLRVLFEQGVLGLMLLFAFLFLTIRVAWQKRSENRGKAVILVALIVGIMVHSLFVDTLHWRHFWLILALI